MCPEPHLLLIQDLLRQKLRPGTIFEIYYYLACTGGWTAITMNTCILINKKPRKSVTL
jgi:hypothetical protein